MNPHQAVPDDVDSLRACMRLWPTGVAILSAGRGESAVGMSVNSLISVSLEPPLVLVSVHREARINAVLQHGAPFAISLLTAAQTELTGLFAARNRPEGRSVSRVLGGVSGRSGVPLLRDSSGALECDVDRRITVGDHVLVVGRVVAAECHRGDHPPQIFHRGALATIAPTETHDMTRSSEVDNGTCRTDCCIVGGGPPGLMLALLMARRGVDVVVVDRRERLDAGGASHEPFLSPPSLEILERLGLLDAVRCEGQPVRQLQECDSTGRRYTLDYSSVPECAYPYALSVALTTLTGVLYRALVREPRATIMTATAVTRLIEKSNGDYAVDLDCGGVARRMESTFVVGSDGKFSALRAMADIEAEVFEFDRPLAMIELPLPSDWPERIAAYHDSRGTLVATMPVAGGNLTVLWATDPSDYDAVRAAGIAELRSRVRSVVPELGDLLADNLTDWAQVAEVRHHVVQPETWFRRNLGLLGDSAHGVHSFGAQGLNMALQDAVVLASVLVDALRNDVPDPLARYEAVRKPFVERFQRFQMGLRPLSSDPRFPEHHTGLYEAISDVMTLGQPEVKPLYESLTPS